MADKSYGLYARVGIYDQDPAINDTTSNYTLEMESFGIRKGQELTTDQIYERGLSSIVGILKAMKRPSPLTLLWSPPDGQKMLFNGIKRRKLRIEIDFVRSGNRTTRPDIMPILVMDNVHIMSVTPEMRNSNGSGAKSKFERIDAHFSKLDLDV